MEKTNPDVNQDTKTSEKTFTQEDLNRLSGSAREEGRLAILKELGIEDVKDAKEALTKIKEQRESEKTELDKANETITKLTKLNNQLQSFKQEVSVEKEIGKILSSKDFEVDTSHAPTVLKLLKGSGSFDKVFNKEEIDTDALTDKVQHILNTDLNMLNKNDTTPKQAGKSIKQKNDFKSTEREYLDRKYGKNPFYTG